MLAFEDFPAHVQLLLLAARLPPTAEERESIRTLTAGGVDWLRFLAVCDHHRLSSLCFESLAFLQPPGLPGGVYDELAGRATANAFEALRATAEARRITDAFFAAGIDLSVLKGVPLSQQLFANPNARHVGDLDFLTAPARLPEQIDLLAKLGYARTNPASRLTPRRLASYVSFWKDFTFANAATGFELDLHWRLFNNRFHPANRLLAGARWTEVTVFGSPVRVLSASDQLLYLAAHGAFDAWTYLKSLADLAACVRGLTADELEQALSRAGALGLMPQVSGAIHLANAWMGAGITHPSLLPATERSARRIRRRTSTMLLRQNFEPQRSFSSPAEWLRLELLLVPGLRSTFELARRFVWRPRVWAAVDLPDRLFWLYPLLALLLPPRPHSVQQ